MSDLLSPASEGSNRSSPAMHILHVEDNLGDIVLFREALRPLSLSVEISVATNGEEALQILYRESPAASGSPIDLILLDINLPRKSGFAHSPRMRCEPVAGGLRCYPRWRGGPRLSLSSRPAYPSADAGPHPAGSWASPEKWI